MNESRPLSPADEQALTQWKPGIREAINREVASWPGQAPAAEPATIVESSGHRTPGRLVG